jgi:biotin carboxyl carrier protein
MKMEMMVPSTVSGRVQQIHVNVEDFVEEGQLLVTLE